MRLNMMVLTKIFLFHESRRKAVILTELPDNHIGGNSCGILIVEFVEVEVLIFIIRNLHMIRVF